MAILFKTTKQLENQIDEFLDAINQGALVFKSGVKEYLEGDQGRFAEHLTAIGKLEGRADELRRNIENQLYSHSLIPEHRGDVLGLLEHLDDVIDTAKETLNEFAVETPEIYPELKKEYLELGETVVAAAESIVLSVRAFFTDVKTVKNHIHKVYFYEKEADKIASNLKRHIFKLSIDLGHKMHLRYFAYHVDSLADAAEAVADRLAIYTIKRTI
jgi:predicted phosphate transport protein (TIGR00153 family)